MTNRDTQLELERLCVLDHESVKAHEQADFVLVPTLQNTERLILKGHCPVNEQHYVERRIAARIKSVALDPKNMRT